MCGIAGVYSLDGAPVDSKVLRQMVAIQRHRGPDDSGLRMFSLKRATSHELASGSANSPQSCEGGLGFARLSIIDLSEHGHQPMVSDDGRTLLAFNGEIYNAGAFKSELQSAGFRFRGTSDTEVVLRLYQHFGLQGMLERINGMYAMAVVDMSQRSLLLIRDGAGIKPLMWTRIGNTILFGSEVKCFLAHPDFKCRLAQDNLDEHLAFRYCAGDRHLLADVHHLRPGHVMHISLEQPPVIRRFYQIPDAREESALSNCEVLPEFEARLRASVESQLLADVAVGCQLSGGLDSSLTTVLANLKNPKSIEAFSIVFRDKLHSEDAWISEAAGVAGADNHRFFFETDDFFTALEPATWHLEQPINHPNTLGIFLLAQKSRPMVKVLLSGEGADELMGGYSRFVNAAIRPSVRPLLPVLSRLPIFGQKWSRTFGTAASDETEFMIAASMRMSPSLHRDIRPHVDIRRLLNDRRAVFDEGQGDYVSRCMKYEMQTHLVDLLVRQDRMTMAHSLEGRVPFLDRDLIAFVRSLPSSLLVGRSWGSTASSMRNTKMLLKTLARKYFSEAFV